MSVTGERMMAAAPTYYESSVIFAEIQEAKAGEFDSLEDRNEDLRNQLYINTATWGLDYWERTLKIKTIPTDSYEIRRSRVLSAWRSRGQFSAQLLRSICEAYSGGQVEISSYTKNLMLPHHTIIAAVTADIGITRVTATVDNAVTLNGYSSIKMVTTGGGTTDNFIEYRGGIMVGAFNGYAAKPNTKYTFSYNGKVSVGQARARIICVDASGAVLSDTYGNIATADAWTRASVTITTPANTAAVLLRAQLSALTGTIWVTEAQLEVGDLTAWEPNKDYAIRITFTGSAGIPPNMADLQYTVENIVHAHLGTDYVFMWSLWDNLDAAHKTFAQLDTYTWDSLEVSFVN